jgi:hypothetical protein
MALLYLLVRIAKGALAQHLARAHKGLGADRKELAVPARQQADRGGAPLAFEFGTAKVVNEDFSSMLLSR